MKKWLVFLGFSLFVSCETIWAGAGSSKPDYSGYKAINGASTEAIYFSSSTDDIIGASDGVIGIINNATITATSTYFYGVFVSSPGSPDARFRVYDTSGNWAPGTRPITSWIHVGNNSNVLPLNPMNVNIQNGLGYTSSGTIPAKLQFLYRER